MKIWAIFAFEIGSDQFCSTATARKWPQHGRKSKQNTINKKDISKNTIEFVMHKRTSHFGHFWGAPLPTVKNYPSKEELV